MEIEILRGNNYMKLNQDKIAYSWIRNIFFDSKGGRFWKKIERKEHTFCTHKRERRLLVHTTRRHFVFFWVHIVRSSYKRNTHTQRKRRGASRPQILAVFSLDRRPPCAVLFYRCSSHHAQRPSNPEERPQVLDVRRPLPGVPPSTLHSRRFLKLLGSSDHPHQTLLLCSDQHDLPMFFRLVQTDL